MIITNRDGTTEFVEGPDEDEINENIRWFLEQKAKAEAKLQEESNNSDSSRKQAA